MSTKPKSAALSNYRYEITCKRGHRQFKLDCRDHRQLMTYLNGHSTDVLAETSMMVEVMADDNLVTRIHFGALSVPKVKSALSTYQ